MTFFTIIGIATSIFIAIMIIGYLLNKSSSKPQKGSLPHKDSAISNGFKQNISVAKSSFFDDANNFKSEIAERISKKIDIIVKYEKLAKEHESLELDDGNFFERNKPSRPYAIHLNGEEIQILEEIYKSILDIEEIENGYQLTLHDYFFQDRNGIVDEKKIVVSISTKDIEKALKASGCPNIDFLINLLEYTKLENIDPLFNETDICYGSIKFQKANSERIERIDYFSFGETAKQTIRESMQPFIKGQEDAKLVKSIFLFSEGVFSINSGQKRDRIIFDFERAISLNPDAEKILDFMEISAVKGLENLT